MFAHGATVFRKPTGFTQGKSSSRATSRRISLNISRPAAIYTCVRRFSHSLFALVALLWLPVSAHCLFEAVPGLEFLRCADETPASHQSARDCNDCCAVEKSHYRAEHVRLTVPTPVLLPVCFVPPASVADTLPAEVSRSLLTTAPPGLPPRWQFLCRTALPVRAPSLAS
jgi:hypothetical protein